MFAHVPRHRPGINIEAATRAAADDDTNGFAFIKVIGVKRARKVREASRLGIAKA